MLSQVDIEILNYFSMTTLRFIPTRLSPHSYDEGYRDIIPEDGIEVVGRVIRKTEDL